MSHHVGTAALHVETMTFCIMTGSLHARRKLDLLGDKPAPPR